MPNTFLHSIAVVAAASAAAAGALTGVSPAPSAPTPSINAPASEAYLRAAYGISAAEAKRRLGLQRDAPAIAADLAKRFPGQYAGSWLDQSRGGVLIVAATEPTAIRAALRVRPDAAHVTTITVARSLRQLQTTAANIAGELGTTVGTDVSIDERANEVVITTGRKIAVGDARLSRIVGPAVRAATRPATIDKSCDPLHCFTQPMRGGIRIDVPRDPGLGIGGCTTGFNVRSGSQIFVLTAGHCVGSATHTHVDTTSHDGHPVGIEDKTLVNTAYPTDYALIPYQAGAAAGWFGRRANEGLVNAYCPGGCASSHDVQINGFQRFEDVPNGSVVCAAGAAYSPEPGETYVDSGAGRGYKPGVRCGLVFDKSDGAIGVKICARPGDSGGPLFNEVTGKALGILTNGDPGSGPCTNPEERNFYSPISKILADANARWAGPDFALGTRPTAPPRR